MVCSVVQLRQKGGDRLALCLRARNVERVAHAVGVLVFDERASVRRVSRLRVAMACAARLRAAQGVM